MLCIGGVDLSAIGLISICSHILLNEKNLFAEEAGNLVSVSFVFQLWNSVFAVLHTLGAAVVKIAARAFFRRRRHISRQDDSLALTLDFGIGDGRCGKERFRVRVQRL